MKKENEVIFDGNKNITSLIYEIRGKQVMLDSDLAKLYECKNGTKEINQAVKNNPKKFPERFSFVLTDEELVGLRSQFATANGGVAILRSKILTARTGDDGLWSKLSTANVNISNKSRSNPRVFTEQGVYMLATILKSSVATEVSIEIMDAFVKMRQYIDSNKMILPNRILLLEEKVDENSKKIDELFNKFNTRSIVKSYIFFEGEFYDAHSVLLDILGSARKEVIMIDNYTNKKLLDVLRKIDKKIVVVSKSIDKVLKEKYESQYKNITFLNNNSFHDRFIIIDRKLLYHSGASFKDLGNKCFAINKIEDKEYLKRLIDYVGLDDLN